DRQRAQEIHLHSRLLASQHLAPTPRTDIMVLLSLIEKRDDKLPSEVVAEALSAIADVLDAKVHIGSGERARLVSLRKSLPVELAGPAERVIHARDEKEPNQPPEPTRMSARHADEARGPRGSS